MVGGAVPRFHSHFDHCRQAAAVATWLRRTGLDARVLEQASATRYPWLKRWHVYVFGAPARD